MHPAGGPDSGRIELYLMCDDLHATIDELKAKGVQVTGDITEAGWGLLTTLVVPGAGEIGLYQPRHRTAYDLD
ncbi:VOC family protein [Nocardia transvalensis]|uniref:VOC family protein n=1 Tax=Nocardia transvalensis TaxID=37333 RepID=UPI001893612A|nr:hypothetical protein [Nocardia transvalensis]MBF6328133.1 hypothetical protein [Nocardia transvalensis]